MKTFKIRLVTIYGITSKTLFCYFLRLDKQFFCQLNLFVQSKSALRNSRRNVKNSRAYRGKIWEVLRRKSGNSSNDMSLCHSNLGSKIQNPPTNEPTNAATRNYNIVFDLDDRGDKPGKIKIQEKRIGQM